MSLLSRCDRDLQPWAGCLREAIRPELRHQLVIALDADVDTRFVRLAHGRRLPEDVHA